MYIILLGLVLASTADENFCTYFHNREPGYEPRLRTCVAYRGNSCCQPDEENIGFNVDPIFHGAVSPECEAIVNQLRCWICHPRQNRFYRNETLTVCRETCGRLLQDCGSALWRDGRVYNYYRNGIEFCEEMGFNVANSQCFSIAATSAARRTATFTSKLATLVMLFAGFLLTGVLTKSSQFNAVMLGIVVMTILLATPSIAQTSSRSREVTEWADRVSIFFNNLADNQLLVNQAQALFDSAEYNEESVNGSEITEHIRQRLSTFAADKLEALERMTNTVANEYNQFVRSNREQPYRNPSSLPLSIYRDSDDSNHLPYDELTFDRLVAIRFFDHAKVYRNP